MPFIMKAGKALGERKAEVRIQFRNSSHLLHGKGTEGMRNELVVSGSSRVACVLATTVLWPWLTRLSWVCGHVRPPPARPGHSGHAHQAGCEP